MLEPSEIILGMVFWQVISTWALTMDVAPLDVQNGLLSNARPTCGFVQMEGAQKKGLLATATYFGQRK